MRNNTFELCSDSFTLEDHRTSDHHTSSGDVSEDVPEDPDDTVNLNTQSASSRPLSVTVPHSSTTNMASTSTASQSSR